MSDTKEQPVALVDPLSYLPRTAVKDYANGSTIYGFDSPNRELHLVIEGYVIITRMSGDVEVIMNLCQSDEFFGESAFVQILPGEKAIAIGPTRVMSWVANDVSIIMLRQPELGLAFTQLMACRCVSLEERIAALSADSTNRRLAKALLYLSERMGQPDSKIRDWKRLPPLSHQLLAQYIGSTRAVVTHVLIQFRREGLIDYSRQRIVVNFSALREWLGDGYQPLPTTCLPFAPEQGSDS